MQRILYFYNSSTRRCSKSQCKVSRVVLTRSKFEYVFFDGEIIIRSGYFFQPSRKPTDSPASSKQATPCIELHLNAVCISLLSFAFVN